MQKEIVKGDGCLRSLAHLYHCIAWGALIVVHILSLFYISQIFNCNFVNEFRDFSLEKLRHKMFSIAFLVSLDSKIVGYSNAIFYR